MDALFSFKSPAVDPASVDAYANVAIMFPDQRCSGPSLTPPTSGPISLNWKNTGANSITTQVLGTNDPAAADADCDVVLAGAAIAPGAMRHAQINPAYYAYYRFQHKATVGGSQGASKIAGCQKRI